MIFISIDQILIQKIEQILKMGGTHQGGKGYFAIFMVSIKTIPFMNIFSQWRYVIFFALNRLFKGESVHEI